MYTQKPSSSFRASALFHSHKLWTALALISFIFFLSSCKKDNNPGPKPPEDYRDPIFKLDFSAATIPLNLVDSATVIFKKTGSQTHYVQRLEKTSTTMQVIINSLSKGEWTANVYLYSAVAGKDEKREYVISKIFEKGTGYMEMSVAAPNGTLNDAWSPRVHYRLQQEIDAYIPLNPEEPYFRLRVADRTKWKSYQVTRGAYNRIPGTGNELISSGDWKCQLNCINNDKLVEDSQFFVPFANGVKNKTWNNGEIEIIAVDQQGVEHGTLIRYNK